MEAQSVPDSVQRLFDQAQTSMDISQRLHRDGDFSGARAQAQVGMLLLAQAAHQVSEKNKELDVLLELVERGKNGYRRREERTERVDLPTTPVNRRVYPEEETSTKTISITVQYETY